jgi:hypothetical protein
MRIITNYKDYYDHVAFMYGGGDPKIVYVRPHRHKFIPIIQWNGYGERMSIGDIHCKCRSFFIIYNLWDRNNRFVRSKSGWQRVGCDVVGIVVGNVIFTKIKTDEDSDYRFVDDNDIKNTSWNENLKSDEFVNNQDETLVNICRATEMPVFSFSVVMNYFHIHELMPNLGKLGIPPYISANAMYQHLSYFIGNTMHESPDLMKPIVVSDRVKIEGHGFDYKTSFRGMK